MKVTHIYTWACLLLLSFTSCSKWLDVKPEDKFVESDVFSTPQGFIDVLNGIYLDLGTNSMYGRDLTMTTFDIMAQYYYISPVHSEYNRSLSELDYEQDGTKSKIASIWEKLYLAIASSNKLLSNLDEYGNVLDKDTRDLFRAETHALRAFFYFELLRTFTPTYTTDPTANLLPYYDEVTYEFSDFKTSEFIMGKILEDLKIAEDLLVNVDPVMRLDRVDMTTESIANQIPDLGYRTYLTFRNYRFNYFAVKALQARANLWKGDKATALQAAKVVIDNKSKFPWVTASEVNDSQRPNRIFSMELLFAVENPDLYDVYNNIFSPNLDDKDLLASGTNEAFLNQVYEGLENDFRFRPMWRVGGDKSYPTFEKYKDLSQSLNQNFRFTVPMIRISEMFLIAAECETDANAALNYLNELKVNRNTLPIGNTDNLTENIMKEYRKEFYGEGQLWFYYKRTQASNIISALGVDKSINKDKYTFPIPLSETDPR